MNDRDFRRLARTESEEFLLRITSVEDIDELFNENAKGPKWVLMKPPASAQTSEPKPYQEILREDEIIALMVSVRPSCLHLLGSPYQHDFPRLVVNISQAKQAQY
ncbi:uncharacterized protein N7458_007391 [Penicillium daleae]|uniref:Uncharacterized protein n=1 Tax=Penicillium daleae TaxID=63821 RepID=A0AAD6C1U2_9EURO|nr:uncharacterized protein N7458_007391 [Penicillium daleae]KAJ5443519.1 hypothetical protein N7458_007391 [Penicillium daleae]